MHYGGDYNPEQWPEEVWPDDVTRMQEAGVTMVSLGIFSWARIQRSEHEFDFDWLDRIIGLLHDGGIAVDLATATASPPPWATVAYPEMLAADEHGNPYWHGSRQHYAPSSPAYRKLASELVTRIADRYAGHPAVVLWHVNNEYGCHLNTDYSDAARDAFRGWLTNRYGTIDALNEAWGTMFWSQRYGRFDEVFPPRQAPYSLNPGQLLDYRRFTSDMLLECYRMERDIIRASGATQPITTNFMGAFKPADYARWAPELDVISDDLYPDPNDPESFREGAFHGDLMRSLKPGTPWLLMEQASSAVNWRPSNAPKAPGQLAAQGMQAVARGADGVLFFQWRQSRAGSEKFHSGMLPHAGTGTRTWREVVALGAQLKELPGLMPDDGTARVAILLDWENWWAIENPDHPTSLDYLSLLRGWYDAAHRLHVQVDLLPPTAELTQYRAVIAPHLYLLGEGAAANLRRYVEQGGHLLVTAFSDVVDEHDRFRPGGYGTQLREVLGVVIEDFGALVPPGAPGPGRQRSRVAGEGIAFPGSLLAEEVHAVGADVLAGFEGGREAGRPAFTANRTGAGTAYYLATVPDDDGARQILEHVFAAAGAEPVLPGLPPMVEAIRRGRLLTVINHGSETVDVSVTGQDAVTGADVRGATLQQFGWVSVLTGD
ncbi:beta-galactosidase [Vibrio cholerae]|nr:beta-galactosidase [Vibrio cholerae]